MKRRAFPVIPALICLCAFACSEPDSLSLPREDLFTLNLGKMENQFDFFFDAHAPHAARNDIFCDEGVFFIVNGNARKVMEFSLLGELTLLLYNPESNPPPVVLPASDPGQDGYGIVSRRAVSAPFEEIGALGVDSGKNVYIEDRGGQTEPGGAMYRKVIKRFDRRGNYLDTIGRTGRDGPPFPAIEEIYLTDANHLVVVCRTAQGSTVYWLDERHSLLYEVEFDYLRLPLPADSTLIPTLGKIVPDYRERRLYLMVSYFSNVKDESTRLVSRVNYIESRIYSFDLERGAYDASFMTIPAEASQSQDPLFSQEKQRTPLPYNFLGVSSAGQFFLLKMRNKTTYELLVLDRSGRTVKKIRIFIDDTDMVSISFHITKSGLLYALVAENTCARVVRWRSDQAVSGGFR